MFNYYSLESIASERQREIHAEVAMQRRLPFAPARGARRALAATLAALAHRLDPYGVGQSLQAAPAQRR